MAVFRVGQRVRITSCRSNPEFAGKEATIIGPLTAGPQVMNGCIGYGYPVDIDGFGRLTVGYNGNLAQIAAEPEVLEPLLPDSYKMVSWSECEWKPPHLREKA